MGKKTKKIEPLSMYEETLIWMSYRYAIGRHTIASNCHCHDIAENAYERLKLTPNRMEFMSKDICNEIAQMLHMSFFSIDGYSINTTGVYPLDLFYEYVNSKEIRDYNDLNKNVKSVTYKNGVYEEKAYSENDFKRYLSYMDFEDLEDWQILAKLLDKKCHKNCKLIDGSICEYIEIYKRSFGNLPIKYEMRKVPVECLAVGRFNAFIPEENIAEDNI